MTPDPEALARRAVACPKWRWMAGMRTLPGSAHNRPAVVLVSAQGEWFAPPEWAVPPSDAHRHEVVSGYVTPGWCETVWEKALPDLEDPATLGCLLALVREAHGDPFGAVAYDGRWRWYGKDGEGRPVADDYAECLVLALEAAS